MPHTLSPVLSGYPDASPPATHTTTSAHTTNAPQEKHACRSYLPHTFMACGVSCSLGARQYFLTNASSAGSGGISRCGILHCQKGCTTSACADTETHIWESDGCLLWTNTIPVRHLALPGRVYDKRLHRQTHNHTPAALIGTTSNSKWPSDSMSSVWMCVYVSVSMGSDKMTFARLNARPDF